MDRQDDDVVDAARRRLYLWGLIIPSLKQSDIDFRRKAFR